MTARQERRAQQKAERKANKLALRTKPAVAEQPAPAEISDRKLAANRTNAQLSTGPSSSIGKQVSSQNRTRHGLTGEFRVMPGESQSDFDTLLDRMTLDHAPESQTEHELIQQMVEALWLSKRSARLQDQALLAFDSDDEKARQAARKDLALFIRYHGMHDRAFTRHSTELRKLRNERRRAERGFESQKLRAAQEARKQERHELSIQAAKAKAERRQAREMVAKPVQPIIPAAEKWLSSAA